MAGRGRPRKNPLPGFEGLVKIYRTHPDIMLPEFQTLGSACFDIAFQKAGKTSYSVYSHSSKPIDRPFSVVEPVLLSLAPGERVKVPTGIILDIPEKFSVRIHIRSSLAFKKGLLLANGEGVIDSDYTDELFIILLNSTAQTVSLVDGERIAQAELVKNLSYSIEETTIQPTQKTNRVGGIGSTGEI